MDRTRVNLRALMAIFGVLVATMMFGPTVGSARAAVAGAAGDAVSVGDPNSLGQIDLYVDPMCPFSGKFITEQGTEMNKHLEDGTLHINLRFVNFLERLSASGTYDARAIYAAYVVADQARSSDVTWRFVQLIFSPEHQPKEKGSSDLSNDQLADLAGEAGAPAAAQDLIRMGLPIGFDPKAIASANLDVLHGFPESGVPMVVIDGQPVDTDSDWMARLPA